MDQQGALLDSGWIGGLPGETQGARGLSLLVILFTLCKLMSACNYFLLEIKEQNCIIKNSGSKILK